MCGIAGVLARAQLDESLPRDMIAPLIHRGPDDGGVWTDPEAGVGLGHRRLAIVELSQAGHQPMTSASGEWVITFNGEIYNFRELRRELEQTGKIAWRGSSDTETLLECIAQWGIDRAIARAVGMFAIALWNRRQRKLILVRDRFGEKPLYYGWVGGDFLFGSELKALRCHPRFTNPISRAALQAYAGRVYVPAPLSIYQGIYKLPPGCIAEVTREAVRQPHAKPPHEGASDGFVLRRYWDYREVVRAGFADPFANPQEADEALDGALHEAIAGQAVADVPVGAFLSGGIDSSTAVAYYQEHSATPVKTFTIGFDDPAFDEAAHARAVASHLGTDHHELYVTPDQVRDVIPALPRMFDEPFADSSQIPTFLVSQFAREHVKVAISGDGGDELFGGYNRYFRTTALWQQMRRLPAPARRALGAALGQLPPAAWDRVGAMLPGPATPPHFGTKVRKALRTMAHAKDVDAIFLSFLDEWSGEPNPVTGLAEADVPPFDLDGGSAMPAALRMMYCDAVTYLPDDILCKVDRAAMAVSLETRVPFLDHRFAAAAARVPLDMKIQGGTGKLALRRLLYQKAPRDLFERPKAGFGMPLGAWLRGPLRDWAEELLREDRLQTAGFFDARQVRQRWAEHLAGKRDAGPTIWAILMFEEWRTGQDDPRAGTKSLHQAG